MKHKDDVQNVGLTVGRTHFKHILKHAKDLKYYLKVLNNYTIRLENLYDIITTLYIY